VLSPAGAVQIAATIGRATRHPCELSRTSSVSRQYRRDTLAATDALGGQGVAATRALKDGGGLTGDAGARGAKRVTDCKGAAIDVDLAQVDTELADAGE
jgi:hypothetical protein